MVGQYRVSRRIAKAVRSCYSKPHTGPRKPVRVSRALAGRIVLGLIVIGRERLTDGDEHSPEGALAIHEVSGDVVTRMWFIEPAHRRQRG